MRHDLYQDDGYDEPYFDDELPLPDEDEIRQEQRLSKKRKALMRKKKTQERLYQLQEQQRLKRENDYLYNEWD